MLRVVAGGLAAIVLLSSGAASAQAQPTARQLELAQRYVSVMRMEKAFEASEALLPAILGPAKDAAAEAKRVEFQAIMHDVNAEFIGVLSVRMAPILAETFTEKELEDLVAFYDGPSGRAIIEKTPQLSVKLTPLVVELMPQIQAKILERLCKDGSCKPSSPAN